MFHRGFHFRVLKEDNETITPVYEMSSQKDHSQVLLSFAH